MEALRIRPMAKALWTVAFLAAALLWQYPLAPLVAFLLPLVLAFWLLRGREVHVAGLGLTTSHVFIAVVIAQADAPDENRAFAPLTAIAIGFALVATVAFVGSRIRRARRAATASSHR